MTDYDELARKAREATPGPWVIEGGSIAWMILERPGGPQVVTRRTRLSLGRRQTETLLLALSYAIDTFVADDDDEMGIGPFERRMVARFEALQDTVRAALVAAQEKGETGS